MGLVSILVIALLGLLGASLSKILAEEFRAWAPTIAGSLLRVAIARLNREDRGRYHEEWQHDLFEVPGDIGKICFALGLILASLRMSDRPLLQFAAKRGLDLIISFSALAVLPILFIVVSTAIKLESPGPILVRYPRVGLGGKVFYIYKFRTTHVAYIEAEGIEVLPTMLTRCGRIFRSTNIEELPELINILTGDMSLVGPRCHRPGMMAAGMPYEQLVKNYHMRHKVRPGLTGLAQLYGYRGSTDREEMARGRIAHDLEYIENFNIWLDIKILAATLRSEMRVGIGL